MESLEQRDFSVLEVVRAWGGATSDAILDPECSLFRLPGMQGLIGYRQEKGCAIVWGDPACAPSEVKALCSAFHQFCEGSIIYVGATTTFADWAIFNKHCQAAIEFGEELVLHPISDDPRKLTGTHANLVGRFKREALKI